MIDFDWSKEIVKDAVDLTDCIELVVAFSGDDYYGRFTYADFIDIVQGELLGEDNLSFFQGDQADGFSEFFEDAMALIKRRASWLGEIYPFRQGDGEVQFSPQTSEKNYLWYLFLLACSCHNRIPSLRSDLPVQFENICKEAMRALFPDWADVFLFSKNSDDRKELGWPAREAIPALAKRLNAQVRKDQLPNTPEEYGIDLIAICSFGDELEYPFFAFAQCTVSREEWWDKREEAQAHRALSGVVQLDIGQSHTNFLLIPHFPRIKATEWEKPRQYHPINCILCDRYRICRLLEKTSPFTRQDIPCSMRDILQKIQKYLPENHRPTNFPDTGIRTLLPTATMLNLGG